MNLADIEAALSKGLEFVQKAAPLAGIAGPTAGAWGELIAQVAGVADGVVKEIEADTTIIASGDKARIIALRDQLQAENAQLAAKVADS